MSTLSLILAILFSAPSSADDIPLVDTAPPQLVRIDSCGATTVTIQALDTAVSDDGLAEVRLLGENVAVSVRFDGSFVTGDSAATVVIRLLDLDVSTSVTIVALDRAGFGDTLVVGLGQVIPQFSSTNLFFEDIPRNDHGFDRFVITNPSSLFATRIDSLRLRSGDRFSIDGFGRGGPFGFSLIPGDTFGIDVTFRPGLPRENFDTLVVYIDCEPYLFPIDGTVGIARLDVTNLDFWQVLVGSEECLEIALINPGSDTVRLTTIDVDGEYRFDTTKIPDLPLDVAPGEDVLIPICFLPRRLGLLLGRVTIISSEADTTGTVAELAGIGVNSFSSVGFDDEGNRLQVTVVPRRRRLTVVSADRDRTLGEFRLFNTRGEEIALDRVDRIGRGWWGITTPDRLDVGIYFLNTRTEEGEGLTVKFVVLE